MLNPPPNKSLVHLSTSLYFNEEMKENTETEKLSSQAEHDFLIEARTSSLSLRKKPGVNYSDEHYFQERLSYSPSQVQNNKRSREIPKDKGFKFVIPEPRLLSSRDDESEGDRTTAHPQKRRKIAPLIAKTSLSHIASSVDDELDAGLDLLFRASEMLSGTRRLNSKIPRQSGEFLVNSKIPRRNPLRKPMIFVGTEEDRDEFRSLGVREDLPFFVASYDSKSYKTSGKFLDISIEQGISQFGPREGSGEVSAESSEEISKEDQGEDLEKIRDEKLIDLEKRNLENLHELTKLYLQKLSEINRDKNKIEEDFNHQKLEAEERFRQKNIKAEEEIILITKEISQFEEQIKVRLGAKNDGVELQLPKTKEEITNKYKEEEERINSHFREEYNRCEKIREDFKNKINMEKRKVNDAFPASYDGESGLEEIAVEAEFQEKMRIALIEQSKLKSSLQNQSLQPFVPSEAESRPQPFELSRPELQVREKLSSDETMAKLKEIVKDPVVINFFEENQIYQNVSKSLFLIEKGATRDGDLVDRLKSGALDDQLKLDVKNLFETEDEEKINVMVSILKEGKEAINRALRDGKMDIIKNMFLELSKINNKKNKIDNHIKNLTLVSFLDSDYFPLIDNEEFKKLIMNFARGKNVKLFDKLIEKNPEFIRKFPEIIYTLVSKDSPRMVLNFFMAMKEFNINQKDKDGGTVFHHISNSTKGEKCGRNSQMVMFCLLLILGGDPSIRDRKKNQLPSERLIDLKKDKAFSEIIELMSKFCELKKSQAEALRVESAGGGVVDQIGGEGGPQSHIADGKVEELQKLEEYIQKITEEKNQALKDIRDRKVTNLRICSEKQKEKTTMLADIERREAEGSELFKEFKSQKEFIKNRDLENLNKGKEEVLQLFDKLQKKVIEIKTLQQLKSEEENKIQELLAKINKKRDEDLEILKERKKEVFQINQSKIQDNQAIFEQNKKEIEEGCESELVQENSDDGLRSPSQNLLLSQVMPNRLSLPRVDSVSLRRSPAVSRPGARLQIKR